jgi:hypothetical protein
MVSLPNGIASHGRTVTNDIGARLRDHAKRRAHGTNGGTVFSTRHVGCDNTRSHRIDDSYFLLSSPDGA